MSLRDQLLKSGLANKSQVNKAEKAAKKRQHQVLQTKKEDPEASTSDEVSLAIAEKISHQQQADRDRNRLQEEARLNREAYQRAVDIMLSGDLSEKHAEQPYYFVGHETKIAKIMVSPLQEQQLALGNLVIVSFNVDYKFFLVDTVQAGKIRSINPAYIICWHFPEKEAQPLI